MEEKRTLTAEDFRFVNRHPKAEIDENYASQSYGRDVLARLCANKGAIIGLVLILSLIHIWRSAARKLGPWSHPGRAGPIKSPYYMPKQVTSQ